MATLFSEVVKRLCRQDRRDSSFAHHRDSYYKEVDPGVGCTPLDHADHQNLDDQEDAVDTLEREEVEQGRPKDAKNSVNQGTCGADHCQEFVVFDGLASKLLVNAHDVVSVVDLGEGDDVEQEEVGGENDLANRCIDFGLRFDVARVIQVDQLFHKLFLDW